MVETFYKRMYGVFACDDEPAAVLGMFATRREAKERAKQIDCTTFIMVVDVAASCWNSVNRAPKWPMGVVKDLFA